MSAFDSSRFSDSQIVDVGICPALGSLSDPETRFAYPSPGNVCHRVDPATGVNLSYQERCCLTEAYVTCPVYLGETQGALPEELRSIPKSVPAPIFRRWWAWLLVAVVFLGGIGGGWWLLGTRPADENRVGFADVVTSTMTAAQADLPKQSDTPAPATIPPSSPPPTSTSTSAPSETPTETPQPSPTNTLPPTPGPGLGTPFGNEVIYVLHRVQEGQGFGVLSNLYQTNEDVIRAANVLREGRTIWPGDILIIPVGQTDPTRVIAFRYLFVEKRTSLDELSQQYTVSVDDIRYYNQLGEDEWIPAGRWLIIPAVGE